MDSSPLFCALVDIAVSSQRMGVGPCAILFAALATLTHWPSTATLKLRRGDGNKAAYGYASRADLSMKAAYCKYMLVGRSKRASSGEWLSGKTTLIRVPETLVEQVVNYARRLDKRHAALSEGTVAYKTASDVDPDVPVNVACVPHRSPFRYPGGKTWLIPYVRTWLGSIRPKPTVLIEPFAGGAIVGLTAAFEYLAEHVVLVEKDADVAAVWRVIFGGQAEWLARRIEQFEFNKQNVLDVLSKDPQTQRERAFVTILRNRVQRGGILAPGAGLVKNGENGRGLRSRWYPMTLAKRIRAIAALRHRFTFIEGDGLESIRAYADEETAAFFIDPPYTVAARRLYRHWEVDHRALFELAARVRGQVLLTYDNTREIAELAQEFGFQIKAVAMKNTHHARMTELLISKDLSWLCSERAFGVSRSQTLPGLLESRP